ncbi:GFA family protein [Ensifer adhaerens]|uniref:GFA family protein n=1 Tax=Ensifer adhaerens TaxID=106592 RepID=UPI003D0555FA
MSTNDRLQQDGRPQDTEDAGRRTASCACGGLKMTVTGPPARVYACACLECQRATGSGFGYRARFSRQAIASIEGERRVWRRSGSSGRWVDQTFCPTCGTLVYMEAEALSDAVVVSVGCFADPEFPPPTAVFWASRRHTWYDLAEGIETFG